MSVRFCVPRVPRVPRHPAEFDTSIFLGASRRGRLGQDLKRRREPPRAIHAALGTLGVIIGRSKRSGSQSAGS
jgi:hypothetical protein